jgi:hypothetical protein
MQISISILSTSLPLHRKGRTRATSVYRVFLCLSSGAHDDNTGARRSEEWELSRSGDWVGKSANDRGGELNVSLRPRRCKASSYSSGFLGSFLCNETLL